MYKQKKKSNVMEAKIAISIQVKNEIETNLQCML